MPSYIPENFEPSPRVLDNLRRKGVFADFLEECVTPKFLIYWNSQKERKLASGKKSSWDTAYYNWALCEFKGRTGREWEANRHRRESHGRGNKGDFFGEALESLQQTVKEAEPPRDYAPPKPRPTAPGGPPMTAEEAFAQLRKDGVL